MNFPYANASPCEKDSPDYFLFYGDASRTSPHQEHAGWRRPPKGGDILPDLIKARHAWKIFSLHLVTRKRPVGHRFIEGSAAVGLIRSEGGGRIRGVSSATGDLHRYGKHALVGLRRRGEYEGACFLSTPAEKIDDLIDSACA